MSRPTDKPILLDAFCGAGGAAKGYQRAGFYVVGIDIKPQPRYCGHAFIQMDAIEALRILNAGGYITDTEGRRWCLSDFDAIHTSPPCQAYTAMRVMPNAGKHPELLDMTRTALLTTGLPFVIENVEQAPLEIGQASLFSSQSGIVLCGSMFDLMTDKYQLRRHRLFESNIPLPQPQHKHSAERVVVGFYGDHARTRTRINGHHARGTDITKLADKLALVKSLMEIDWMTWDEAKEAIPPAYTEFTGRQLMKVVSQARENAA